MTGPVRENVGRTHDGHADTARRRVHPSSARAALAVHDRAEAVGAERVGAARQQHVGRGAAPPISPPLMFRWLPMQSEGALAGLDADERVVAETEVKELRSPRARAGAAFLGRKTMEPEILKVGIEHAQKK